MTLRELVISLIKHRKFYWFPFLLLRQDNHTVWVHNQKGWTSLEAWQCSLQNPASSQIVSVLLQCYWLPVHAQGPGLITTEPHHLSRDAKSGDAFPMFPTWSLFSTLCTLTSCSWISIWDGQMVGYRISYNADIVLEARRQSFRFTILFSIFSNCYDLWVLT